MEKLSGFQKKGKEDKMDFLIAVLLLIAACAALAPKKSWEDW